MSIEPAGCTVPCLKGLGIVSDTGASHQLMTLLRISAEVDVIGDVTAVAVNPADMVAWAYALPDPTVRAWRATGSGHRYLHISAASDQAPVRGKITAVLDCEDHPLFWASLLPNAELDPGDDLYLAVSTLAAAWAQSDLP